MSRELPPSLRKQSFLTRRPDIIAGIIDEFWREPFGIFSLQPFLRDRSYPALNMSESDAQIMIKSELPEVFKTTGVVSWLPIIFLNWIR